MTDTILMKNDVFRVVGRQVGLWVWQGFELGCSFVLPWLVAGELVQEKAAGPQAAQQPAAGQQGVQQQAAVNVAVNVAQQNPGFFNRVKDLAINSIYFGGRSVKFVFSSTIALTVGTVRGSINAVKWVDGTISSILGTIDEKIDRRFKGIPGYRLLTWYPLRLGNWENTYKQTRNYLLINPVWQRTVQPYLKENFFDKYATIASSYMAPYADVALRYGDKAMSAVLGLNFSGGEDFSLGALQNSFAARWFQWARGNGTTLLTSHAQKVIDGVYVSTHGIETLAEQHIQTLRHAGTQVLETLSVINGYTGQVVTFIGGILNDAYRFGHCVTANNGANIMPCVEKAGTNLMANYWTPFIGLVQGYITTPLWNGAVEPAVNYFVNTNSYTKPILGSMSYFYECSTVGNGGYVDFTNTPCLEQVQGFGQCSLHLGKYAISNGLNGIWNFGAMTVNFLWEDLIKANVSKIAETAMENPGTAIGICAAVPVVLLSGFGAKVIYERVMRPNAQHVVHHGLQQQLPQQQPANVDVGVGVGVGVAANPNL